MAPAGEFAWRFDPVPPSGAIRGGIPVAYVFTADLDVFVREALQNAHDQKRQNADTATVVFDLITISGDFLKRFLEAARWEGVRSHLVAVSEGDALNAGQIRAALHEIEEGSDLVVLRVHDSGTLGLTGDEDQNGSNYKALVRNVLDTTESKAHRGGSHGLGKAVLWSFSDVGTVLFSSSIKEQDGSNEFRLIGRTDLSHHDTNGDDWDGPGWLGDGDPDRPRSVSIWNDTAHGFAIDLFLERDQNDQGTSLLIVGFHEPRQESPRELETVARDIAHHTAENFWPAISKGTLEVAVRVFDNETLRAEFPVEVTGELDLFHRAAAARTVTSRATDPGSTAERMLQFTVPASQGPDLEGAGVPERVANLRLRLIRAAEDDSSDNLNRVALVRGAGMVVDYWKAGRVPLSGGGFRAVLQAGQALDDVEGFDTDANLALEGFLRAAEPPSHNKWDPYTARLRSQFKQGAVTRLRGLWGDINEAIVDMCELKPPSAADGPDRLKALFPLGGDGPPPRPRFRVEYDYRTSWFDPEQMLWVLKATVHRSRRDGDRPWVVEASVRLEGDSGTGSLIPIEDVEIPPGSDAYAVCESSRCKVHVLGVADAVTFTAHARVSDVDSAVTNSTRARLLVSAHDEAVE